jgi:hypothetical protein
VSLSISFPILTHTHIGRLPTTKKKDGEKKKKVILSTHQVTLLVNFSRHWLLLDG